MDKKNWLAEAAYPVYIQARIAQIKLAIQMAERRESKLTPLAFSVPALSSINIRHLMNNLGAITTRYAECGVHKGGLFCSVLSNNSNIVSATAVDNWASDETNEDKAEPQFDENVIMTKPLDTELKKIKRNSFDVRPDELLGPIDLYLYDADHSEESQYNALIHFLPAMADEFIWCVDDFDFPEVERGTWIALRESQVEVLHQWIAIGNNHDNENFWNGFAVFLLRKK